MPKPHPLTAGQPRAIATVPEIPLSRTPYRPATILLIEPFPPLAAAAIDALRQACYSVWFAQSAAEAAILLTRGKPDLIVLNVSLPDADGLALCASWAQEFEIPIVLRGTEQQRGSLIRGLQAGATDYVVHPDAHEFEARLGAILRWRIQPSRAAASLPTAA